MNCHIRIFVQTLDLTVKPMPSLFFEACLKLSRSWPAVEDALQQLGLTNAEAFLLQNLGKHCAPTSPVVSVVLNMLNADLWQQ